MTRKQTIVGVTIFSLVCLAIGVVWTLRTQPPSGSPWWAGKDPKVRFEVWEPGKDMATVGMTLPKKSVDTMVALGMKAKIEVGDYSLDIQQHWRRIQALPPGQKLALEDDGATLYAWIETSDMKPAPVTPYDSTAADSARI